MAVKECLIGGLHVHIHGLSTLKPGKPVTVVFLMHGRMGSHIDFINTGTLPESELSEKNSRPELKQQL
jgi:hypothetical protein